VEFVIIIIASQTSVVRFKNVDPKYCYIVCSASLFITVGYKKTEKTHEINLVLVKVVV